MQLLISSGAGEQLDALRRLATECGAASRMCSSMPRCSFNSAILISVSLYQFHLLLAARHSREDTPRSALDAVMVLPEFRYSLGVSYTYHYRVLLESGAGSTRLQQAPCGGDGHK